MTWLAGMEGIAADYRHMEGYGVNTFTLINHEGKDTYVKFHWRPRAGASNTCHVPKPCPHLLISLGQAQGHLCELSLGSQGRCESCPICAQTLPTLTHQFGARARARTPM